MSIKEVLVPDIGNFDSVDVIEVLVSVGDTVAKEDSLITVESDKASMDIPSSLAGVVKEIHINVGDKTKQGALILTLDTAGEAAPAEKVAAQPTATPVVATVTVDEAKVAIPEPTRPVAEGMARLG